MDWVGTICLFWSYQHTLTHEIQHHIVDIAEILFFLLGAMTIVELIDAHQGFSIITDKITTNKKISLIWILSIITFFFSALLDNLTTAIIMAALLPKIIKDKETLWLFAGTLILSKRRWRMVSNWRCNYYNAVDRRSSFCSNIINAIIIPSIVCAVIPLTYLSFKVKGDIERPKK